MYRVIMYDRQGEKHRTTVMKKNYSELEVMAMRTLATNDKFVRYEIIEVSACEECYKEFSDNDEVFVDDDYRIFCDSNCWHWWYQEHCMRGEIKTLEEHKKDVKETEEWLGKTLQESRLK